jgi:CheY-like chemotaxis protein
MLLIVDDNKEVRRLLLSLLGDLESDFRECEDGDEAIEAYKRNRPDWVLMDIAMGRMSGLTATRRITEIDPQARIIIVSNYGDEALQRAAREAGACGYVMKENLMQVREIIKGVPTAIAAQSV